MREKNTIFWSRSDATDVKKSAGLSKNPVRLQLEDPHRTDNSVAWFHTSMSYLQLRHSIHQNGLLRMTIEKTLENGTEYEIN